MDYPIKIYYQNGEFTIPSLPEYFNLMEIYSSEFNFNSEFKDKLITLKKKLNFHGTYKFFNLYDFVYEQVLTIDNLDQLDLTNQELVNRLDFLAQILNILTIVIILILIFWLFC